jgi:hypothetical protein
MGPVLRALLVVTSHMLSWQGYVEPLPILSQELVTSVPFFAGISVFR